MNAESVAVLVISCDAYRDLWQPFFDLFWKHWPDCPYPVHLGSEVQTHADARVRRLDVGCCGQTAVQARTSDFERYVDPPVRKGR